MSSHAALVRDVAHTNPMDRELQSRLERATNLPTLPAVAVRIIELARDPDADLGQVADAVSHDPALVTKILRIANSPFYALRRRCDNLRQALTFLGINGTLALALSFSLVKAFGHGRASGLDHNWLWRRALLAAASGRVLADTVVPSAGEELFLGSLLQDIGVLALDSAVPGFYAPLADGPADHDAVVELERRRLGADHSEVGAWLLNAWHLPAHIQLAAGGSHSPEAVSTEEPTRTFVRCVCVSGHLAEVWLSGEPGAAYADARRDAQDLLGLDQDAFREIVQAVSRQLPEVETLFEMDLGDPHLVDSLLDQAKEAQVLRNLDLVREASTATQARDVFETRARDLEEQSRRDALTGLFDRGHLDKVLIEEFDQARHHGWPLTVAFADLDHFKRVNDTYGHQAGDRVLAGAAQLLTQSTRGGDIIARYGGEEFVLLFPGSDIHAARIVCERLVSAFRRKRHEIGDEHSVTVTISIGLVALGGNADFGDAAELVRAADRALYAAKLAGRDRFVVHQETEAADTPAKQRRRG